MYMHWEIKELLGEESAEEIVDCFKNTDDMVAKNSIERLVEVNKKLCAKNENLRTQNRLLRDAIEGMSLSMAYKHYER